MCVLTHHAYIERWSAFHYIKNHPFPHPFAASTVKRDAAILQVSVRGGGGGGDVVESSGNSKTASMTDLSLFFFCWSQ